MSKIENSQRGSILVIVALMMVVLIGFLGLAVDIGYATVQKTRLQATADAEALACVVNPASNPCPTSGGDIYPSTNLYGFNITTNNPGNSSLCVIGTQTGCVEATAQTSWNTFFMGFLGKGSINMSATAIAGKLLASPSCFVTTSNFSANGSNQITLNDCGATIGGTLSTTNSSGIKITGTGNTTVYNGNSPNGCGTCTPAPIGVAGAIPTLPSPTIPTKNLNGVALATLPYTSCTNSSCVPAIYTGGQVTLASNTIFQSGVYVFNGGFNSNGQTVSNAAGGVSLYIPGNQPLNLTGHVTLTAPSPTGCAAGSEIVISHPYSTSYNSVTLNGSTNALNLTGVSNLSADDITVSGSSAGLNFTGSVVTHSITLHGNMYPTVSGNPCFNLYESTGRASLLN